MALIQTSPSAPSNRTGIWVTNDSSTWSRLAPSTPLREPVMPTSQTKAVPPGRIRASAVGTWVWVPTTAAARPSRCQPMAIFSLVISAWKSTKNASAWPSRRSRIASASTKGERATFSITAPLRLMTASRMPAASTTVWPRPGLAAG